ncbi:DNAJ heat shock N-terminal domain-containing protein [Actinidia rufa]|uniref:DNAJ heat shock N-terminal domain-containing protein n=1 Tax=Actinidia rufa TaxID=165716 RepID=A0A7J0HFF9_9ERIC|nr:DNAJ heat shock N-terminal domain-containing protein [Actinidia rufa]
MTSDAFKLIGEAQRVLLDCQQRTLHDNKCRNSRTVAPNWVPQPVSSNPNVGKPPWTAQNHFKSKGTSQFTSFGAQHQHTQKQPQPTFPNGRQTFWTLCPFCFMRFQFYRNAVNKILSCPKCKKIFTGHEIGAPATPPVFPQQKEAPTWDAKVGPQVNVGSENRTREAAPKAGISEVNHRKGSIAEAGGKSKNSRKLGAVDVKINKDGVVKESKSPERVNGQKRKQVTESSESCNSGSSSDFEEGVPKQNLGCYGECPRRSARLKQHVSYVENLYDGDKNLMSSVDRGGLLKRAKCSGSFLATEQEAEDPLLKDETPEMNKPDSYGVNKEKDVIEVKLKESVLHKASLQNGKEETNKANGDIRATKDDHSRSPGANIESSSNSSPNVATDPKVEAGNMHANIPSSESPREEVEPATAFKGSTSGCQMSKTPQDLEAFEIPDPEFYDFYSEKLPEKFRVGQVWALYSDEDGLPKYYAQIKKIGPPSKFRLDITWLVASVPPNNAIQWVDKNMPICCGRFRLTEGRSVTYIETGTFSHKLKVEHTGEKDEYTIFPRKDEVWALYKNWNAGMTCSDLESCEYDIVQILKENDAEIKVLVLELVNGFKTVFKAQTRQRSPLTMKFSQKELLRFSHQIPAFRLTEERGGSLRGYWELDPAALPVNLLSST